MACLQVAEYSKIVIDWANNICDMQGFGSEFWQEKIKVLIPVFQQYLVPQVLVLNFWQEKIKVWIPVHINKMRTDFQNWPFRIRKV